MNILIIGCGRMGVRHVQGIVGLDFVKKILLLDLNEQAILNAKETILKSPHGKKCEFRLIGDVENLEEKYQVGIIAATASNRKELCTLALNAGCQTVLIEKPLGQSMEEVYSLSRFMDSGKIRNAVNLNMRLYESFARLKKDLATFSQFKGEKTITVNTGTLGIGANGIHYLDLLYYLFDADKAEIVACEIDDSLIPSGRGPQFGDFGGWAVIKLSDSDNNYLGKAMISMSSVSTVFGSWDIVGTNGRITINEVEQKRIDLLRKEDSAMPINRYAADYLSPLESKFESPFLGDLTAIWLNGLHKNQNLLPSISESIKVHELMFRWLSHSRTHKQVFPIT